MFRTGRLCYHALSKNRNDINVKIITHRLVDCGRRLRFSTLHHQYYLLYTTKKASIRIGKKTLDNTVKIQTTVSHYGLVAATASGRLLKHPATFSVLCNSRTVTEYPLRLNSFVFVARWTLEQFVAGFFFMSFSIENETTRL